VDVVAVERRDERGMQQRDGLVRDLVGTALDIPDALDQLGSPRRVGIIAHEIEDGHAALDRQGAVPVEQREKTCLTRHQGGEEPHYLDSPVESENLYTRSIGDPSRTW
jgi:hypothetical protein